MHRGDNALGLGVGEQSPRVQVGRALGNTHEGVFHWGNMGNVPLCKVPAQDALHGEVFNDEPPRRTLISPFVKEVEYHYINYEEENPQWEIEQTPLQEADDSYQMPERIVLKFRFKGEEVTRQLILPKVMEGTPIL